MSASLVLVAVMAVLFAVGTYLLLERSMTRVLLGFLLLGNATNLLILIVSGPAGTAPFYADHEAGASIADPLPQAFVLTSIVITFGVSAFLMALIYRSWRLAHADVVETDTEDVEIARREAAVAQETGDAAAEDTEFGTRAAAAVTGALDLEEAERLEEEAARAEEERMLEQRAKEERP